MTVARVVAPLCVTLLVACAAPQPDARPAGPTPASSSPDAVADPTTSPPPPDATAAAASSEVVGSVPVDLAPEVSGIDVGVAVDGLWLVDDEPGTDVVHLVGLDGDVRTSVTMLGVDTVNPEDLAVGPCPEDASTSCVHVADIGDNIAARGDVVVFSFPETAATGGSSAVTPTTRRLQLSAPVDAEAMVVLADGTVVVIDRSPDVAGVHVVGPGDDQLQRVAEISLPPPGLALRSLFAGRVVTAADITVDGRSLLLRTYDQLLELTPPSADGSLAPTTWGSWRIAALPVPQAELQGEAAAWLDDDRVVTMSEGSSAITVTTRSVGTD